LLNQTFSMTTEIVKPKLPAKLPATPFYFYDEKIIAELSQRFLESVGGDPNVVLHYAMKANSNPVILKLLRKYGTGIDTVSGEELKLAMECGYAGDLVVYSGVGKSEQELKYAANSQIGMIIVESREEFEELCTIVAKMKKKVKVGFRFNPNLSVSTHPYIATGLWEHKFGMAAEEILEMLRKAPKNLIFEGLSLHLGSQIFEYKVFYDAVEEVVKLARKIKEKFNISFPVLNVGGGLGVDYKNPYQLPDFENYGKFLKDSLGKWQKLNPGIHCKVYSECGRALVAQAGFLVTKVIRIKSNPKKNFAVVDASMSELIRPALYQAHHEIEKIEGSKTKEVSTYDVVGPVCESGDFLGLGRSLQKLQKGDLLWVTCAGAYGYVMSNHYNLRPLPAEYLLGASSKLKLLRKPLKTWTL
jgi:diaminopimelate decarboxylase